MLADQLQILQHIQASLLALFFLTVCGISAVTLYMVITLCAEGILALWSWGERKATAYRQS